MLVMLLSVLHLRINKWSRTCIYVNFSVRDHYMKKVPGVDDGSA